MKFFGCRSVVVVLILLVLAGCTPILLDTAKGIFTRTDVNLIEKNYAAADYLAGQGRHFLRHSDVITAQPLVEIYHPETSSQLARIVPEQVGTRLSQLGYDVKLDNVKTAAGSTPLGVQGIQQSLHPRFILSGSYLRGRDSVDVSLRITEAGTERVVASFDYPLLLNREIKKLSAPRARIYRVEQ